MIGGGAHGQTYLAEHEFLNHPCVVKVLPHRVADPSDAAVRRLRSEAVAGFRVNDPHVVRVIDCDVHERIWYFVMEFVDSIDLAQVAAAGTPLDWRQSLRVAGDAARGLAAIHRAGLLHRDIKPGNLLLGTDGRVRIADLGVARFASAEASDSEEQVGTPGYAAPEVFESDGGVSAATDLYSLGATLFELVTGIALRGRGSIYEAALGACDTDIHWPTDAPTDVPDWFVNAILRLLRCDPQQRFESADALVAFLEQPTTHEPDVQRRQADTLEPRGLVVLPFRCDPINNTHDWLGYALADHLARALGQVPDVYVADRDHLPANLLSTLDGSGSERADRLLAAGRLIGAATVIEGSFVCTGDAIELEARAYASGDRRSFETGRLSGSLSSLVGLEAELFARVARGLDLADRDAVERPSANAAVSTEAQAKFFNGKRAFLRGDYQTAVGLAREALELDPQFVEAVGFAGVCCARMGCYEEAEAYNARQEELAIERGDTRARLEAYANRGSMHYFRGEYEPANACLAQAARTAEELGMTTALAQIQNNLGFVLLQLGRQAEAERVLLRAIETHKSYGALVALVAPYNGLGNVLREAKRYEEARSYFNRALTLAQESDDQVNVGVAYMNLGQCAMFQGRLRDAKHELALALNILETTSFWNGLARVYECMAELNIRLQQPAEAIRCTEKRIELARLHSNRRMEAEAWKQKAASLRLDGRDDEAQACDLKSRDA